MSDAKVAAAGIQLEKAQAGTLRDTLRLNGVLQSNQEQTVQITPRFPGVVRDVQASASATPCRRTRSSRPSRATRA